MSKRMQYLPITEWVARGWTTYDPKYIASLIPLGELGDENNGWDMIGGTYRIADSKANKKRLGNRQRVKKSSKKNNNATETT